MLARERSFVKRIAAEQSVVWHPLAKQQLERDTTFLLDGEVELGHLVGVDGFMPMSYSDIHGQWALEPALGEADAKVAVVDGKYRKGFQAQAATTPRGAMWLFQEGLLGEAEFNIEFWAKTVANPWSAGGTLLQIGTSPNLPDQEGLWVGIQGGNLETRFAHNQDGAVVATINRSVSGGLDLAAGTFHNIGITYKAQRLTVYFDSVEVAHVDGVKPPKRWGGGANEGGLKLGNQSPDWVISDLRISRRARTPGQAVTLQGHTVITVDPASPTGKTIESKLAGVLHNMTHDVVGHDSTTDTAVSAAAAGVIKTLRTDKMVNATPIKAGAPDSTHPTAGQSGSYSYDWQVVDRTVAYAVARNLELYLSLDSTPQILGGASGPFTGTDLTTKMSGEANFNDQVPNDIPAFGTICADLVHHITVTLGVPLPRVGVWNEPDWAKADYYAVYASVANAVKAIDPTIKVGGPELGGFDAAWFDGLIEYCADHGTPLDFISWHFYGGLLSEPAYARAVVEAARTAHGFAGQIELLNGEWEGAGGILEVKPPGWDSYLHADDWGAAWIGRSFVEFHRWGVVRACMLWVLGKATPDGIAPPPTGLFRRTDLKPWANFNVCKLWSMLKPTEVAAAVTADADPGIGYIATKDGSGLDVFLASLHFRRGHSDPVTLAGLAAYNGEPVTVYAVDDERSNLHNAGDARANLESYDGGVVSGGQVVVRLRPRSVALVRVG